MIRIKERRIKDNTKINDSKNYNEFFIFITGLILILAAGLRWRIGADYVQYARNYNMYVN